MIKRAAQALGYLCVGHPVTEVVDPAVSALLGMQGSKNEDVLFSVGEALCFAFGGAWGHESHGAAFGLLVMHVEGI